MLGSRADAAPHNASACRSDFILLTSTAPARYLALRGSFGAEEKYKTTLSVSKGGDCIDYKEEDPEIRWLYKKALAQEGIKSSMAPSLYA